MYVSVVFFLIYRIEQFSDRSFLVANNQPNSCHIIFCSDGFCKMTGFTRAEVNLTRLHISLKNVGYSNNFDIYFPFFFISNSYMLPSLYVLEQQQQTKKIRLCNEMLLQTFYMGKKQFFYVYNFSLFRGRVAIWELNCFKDLLKIIFM